MSLPQLRGQPGRTALMVGGIATGVALIVAITVVNESVRASFRRTITEMAGPAALEVTFGFGEVAFPERHSATVAADSDVIAAVPRVHGTIAPVGDPTMTLQLIGVDFAAESALARYHVQAVTDRRTLLQDFANPRAVLLTGSVASALGATVGDDVPVLTVAGAATLRLRGLLAARGLAAALGGQVAVMDLPAAQMLLAKHEQVDQIDVLLRDGADVQAVAARLRGALPAVLNVARPAQRSAHYDRVLTSFQAMLTGLSTMCLIAGLFIVYGTSATAALERGLAIARLRRLGLTRARAFRLLMLEAGILGAIGALAGIGIGVPLAWLLTGTVASSMGVVFQLRFPVDQWAIAPATLAVIAAAGVLVACLGCGFAARRMSTLDPLAALRVNPRELLERVATERFLALWLLLLACSLAAFVVEDRAHSIAWGNVGSSLWNLAVIALAIPLMQALADLILRRWPRLFGTEGQIAAGSLARAPRRAGITIAAIALVMAVAIALSSLVESCRESLRSYFAGFLSADLVVSAVTTEGGWLETPLPESLADEVARLPGVARVDTARALTGQPFRGDRIGLLALSDDAFHVDRYPPGWFAEGDAATAAPAVRAGKAVTISTSLAHRAALHVGDTITLTSPTGPLTLPIVGVVPDYISDRGSVILSRRLLARHWGDRRVNRLSVFLEPAAALADVRTAIHAALGDRYRLKVLTLRELLDYHTGMIDRAFAVMHSVQLLIVIVTIAGIVDLLLARIAERRRELAVWRLLGADRATIRRAVLVESGTIGGLGALLGLVMGITSAWLWVGVHFRQLLGYYVDFHLAWGHTAWYVVLVLALTTAAGFTAARAATRPAILDGIRTD